MTHLRSSSDTQRPSCSRRQFLGNSARNAVGVAAGALSLGLAAPPAATEDVLHVGVIGLGNQGLELAKELSAGGQARIVGICDVDATRVAAAQQILSRPGHPPAGGVSPPSGPTAYSAHEALLDRTDLDAVIVATPDHWHYQQALDVCRSGRHLYLEQPVTHTPAQAEHLGAEMIRSGCVVQMGLPHRSGAHFQSAVAAVQTGEIGRVHLVKAWATHRRRSIGRTASSAPPAGVDYARWLGPAPARPFQANRFHGHWPWHWDYGAGELGLWGAPLLDVARWGLQLGAPQRICAIGGRRALRDDRDTPDTLQVAFTYEDVDLIWEHRQWSGHGVEGRTAATAFYGEHGTLIVDRSGWKIYDGPAGRYADAAECRRAHLLNWIDAIRRRTPVSAPYQLGAASSLLAQLGNASYRVGRELYWDANSGRCLNDDEANALLGWPASSAAD